MNIRVYSTPPNTDEYVRFLGVAPTVDATGALIIRDTVDGALISVVAPGIWSQFSVERDEEAAE